MGYLLIDPTTGEPRQTFYSNSAAGNSLNEIKQRRSSAKTTNGSEYILPPEIRAEIVAAAKRGKLQQYLQLRKHSLQAYKRGSIAEGQGTETPCLLTSTTGTEPRMHAAVISRNLQQQRARNAGNVPTAGGPPLPYPYVGGPVPKYVNGKPPAFLARGHVKHIKVKGKKGKKSKKETYDLIVNIDLQEWQLTNEQVAEYKEVFMLFDKDEDGVLSFPELAVVMKSLGQRPSDEELLKMVQDVSEDPVYHTIEFNEFLQLLSKQQRSGTTRDSLTDAFSIFDKDDDGYIPVHEMREILQSLGDKMTDKELDEMMKAASSDREGFINYEEFVTVLCGKKRTSPNATET